jgi:hypothetical protein
MMSQSTGRDVHGTEGFLPRGLSTCSPAAGVRRPGQRPRAGGVIGEAAQRPAATPSGEPGGRRSAGTQSKLLEFVP